MVEHAAFDGQLQDLLQGGAVGLQLGAVMGCFLRDRVLRDIVRLEIYYGDGARRGAGHRHPPGDAVSAPEGGYGRAHRGG